MDLTSPNDRSDRRTSIIPTTRMYQILPNYLVSGPSDHRAIESGSSPGIQGKLTLTTEELAIKARLLTETRLLSRKWTLPTTYDPTTGE